STCRKVWDRLLTGVVLDALEAGPTEERPPGGGRVRAGASGQRPGGGPGRPRTGDRRAVPRDPPPQLPPPGLGPGRLGPGLPPPGGRRVLAPAAAAAGRAHDLRGGPPRVGVRRAVRRLPPPHLAAAAVPLLSRSGRVRRRVTSNARATGRSPRPVALSR